MNNLVWPAVALLLLIADARADSTNSPSSLPELDKWYVDPPANQNAAIYFEQAFTTLIDTNTDVDLSGVPWIGDGQPPMPNRPFPREGKDVIAEVGQRIHSAWSLLQKGATCDRSRYPINLGLGAEALLPHLAKIRYATRLLALWTTYQASIGECKEASETLRVALSIGKSLEPEPLLVSQEFRSACVTPTVQSLEQVLNRCVLTPDVLNEIKTALAEVNNRFIAGTNMERALVGERLVNLGFFDSSLESRSNILFQIPGELMSRAEMSLDAEKYSSAKDKEFMAETYTLLLNAWRRPYPDRLRATADICSARERLANRGRYIVSVIQLRAILTALQTEVRSIVYLRLAIIAIALEQFRLSHENQYPSAIADLPQYIESIPRSLSDWSGPQYERTARGFYLWSTRKETSEASGKAGKNSVAFRVSAL